MLLTPMRSPIFKWIISPSDPMTSDDHLSDHHSWSTNTSQFESGNIRKMSMEELCNKNRIFSAAHKVQGEKGAHPTISHTKGWFTL